MLDHNGQALADPRTDKQSMTGSGYGLDAEQRWYLADRLKLAPCGGGIKRTQDHRSIRLDKCWVKLSTAALRRAFLRISGALKRANLGGGREMPRVSVPNTL